MRSAERAEAAQLAHYIIKDGRKIDLRSPPPGLYRKIAARMGIPIVGVGGSVTPFSNTHLQGLASFLVASPDEPTSERHKFGYTGVMVDDCVYYIPIETVSVGPDDVSGQQTDVTPYQVINIGGNWGPITTLSNREACYFAVWVSERVRASLDRPKLLVTEDMTLRRRLPGTAVTLIESKDISSHLIEVPPCTELAGMTRNLTSAIKSLQAHFPSASLNDFHNPRLRLEDVAFDTMGHLDDHDPFYMEISSLTQRIASMYVDHGEGLRQMLRRLVGDQGGMIAWWSRFVSLSPAELRSVARGGLGGLLPLEQSQSQEYALACLKFERGEALTAQEKHAIHQIVAISGGTPLQPVLFAEDSDEKDELLDSVRATLRQISPAEHPGSVADLILSYGGPEYAEIIDEYACAEIEGKYPLEECAPEGVVRIGEVGAGYLEAIGLPIEDGVWTGTVEAKAWRSTGGNFLLIEASDKEVPELSTYGRLAGGLMEKGCILLQSYAEGISPMIDRSRAIFCDATVGGKLSDDAASLIFCRPTYVNRAVSLPLVPLLSDPQDRANLRIPIERANSIMVSFLVQSQISISIERTGDAWGGPERDRDMLGHYHPGVDRTVLEDLCGIPLRSVIGSGLAEMCHEQGVAFFRTSERLSIPVAGNQRKAEVDLALKIIARSWRGKIPGTALSTLLAFGDGFATRGDVKLIWDQFSPHATYKSRQATATAWRFTPGGWATDDGVSSRARGTYHRDAGKPRRVSSRASGREISTARIGNVVAKPRGVTSATVALARSRSVGNMREIRRIISCWRVHTVEAASEKAGRAWIPTPMAVPNNGDLFHIAAIDPPETRVVETGFAPFEGGLYAFLVDPSPLKPVLNEMCKRYATVYSPKGVSYMVPDPLGIGFTEDQPRNAIGIRLDSTFPPFSCRVQVATRIDPSGRGLSPGQVDLMKACWTNLTKASAEMVLDLPTGAADDSPRAFSDRVNFAIDRHLERRDAPFFGIQPDIYEVILDRERRIRESAVAEEVWQLRTEVRRLLRGELVLGGKRPRFTAPLRRAFDLDNLACALNLGRVAWDVDLARKRYRDTLDSTRGRDGQEVVVVFDDMDLG